MHSPGFRENHIRFQTKMSKVNLKTRFETKTAQSRALWDGTYPYDLYRGVPPPKGGLLYGKPLQSFECDQSKSS